MDEKVDNKRNVAFVADMLEAADIAKFENKDKAIEVVSSILDENLTGDIKMLVDSIALISYITQVRNSQGDENAVAEDLVLKYYTTQEIITLANIAGNMLNIDIEVCRKLLGEFNIHFTAKELSSEK